MIRVSPVPGKYGLQYTSTEGINSEWQRENVIIPKEKFILGLGVEDGPITKYYRDSCLYQQ